MTCVGLTSSSGLTDSSGNLNLSNNAIITGTLNCGLITAVGNSVFSGGYLTTQAIDCTGITASGEIANTAGGMSIIGTGSITGNLTVSGTASFAVTGTSMTFAKNNSTNGINPLTTSNVGLCCQPSGCQSGQRWVRITQGSSGFIECNSWDTNMTFTAGNSSWTSGSDIRLKDVTGTYTNALEYLKQIAAIKYRWNTSQI